MKRSIFTLLSLLLPASMAAQDIYKAEALTSHDLNGTARYVGMGGAMNALGADLSTMGSNPAAIGMYRRSDVAITSSVSIQPNVERSFADVGKARASFDQAGFVYSANMDDSFINFGFNYQKRRNFKNLIDIASHNTGSLSQSWQLADLCYVGHGANNGWLDLDLDADRSYTTPLALAAYDTYLIDKQTDADGNLTRYNGWDADNYGYRRAQWGGIEQYDFNLSMNFNDRWYAGVTLGLYNVNMHSEMDYFEALRFQDGTTDDSYLGTSESLTGTGFDVKAGVIVRPDETSPFRIGFSVATPIWYDLTQNSSLRLSVPNVVDPSEANPYREQTFFTGDNDYRFRSPWRFNLSAATTIDNVVAIDAEYELASYSSSSFGYPENEDYGYGYASTSTDRALNKELDRFLKPVHTFRIGAEARLSPQVFFRGGYNYVSSPFEKDAYLNLFTASPSYYYATNTDYVNLGDINRVTLGLGYRGKSVYVDLAYQYQVQKADVYAFHDPASGTEQNLLSAHSVNLDRHNLMATVGFKF